MIWDIFIGLRTKAKLHPYILPNYVMCYGSICLGIRHIRSISDEKYKSKLYLNIQIIYFLIYFILLVHTRTLYGELCHVNDN